MRIPHTVGVTLAALLALTPVAVTHVAAAPQVSLSDRIQAPSFGTSVPMDDQSGRPVVEVWINGRGPYLFIVGTAASVTAVTQDLAAELDLAPVTDELASGPFVVNELRVGGATAQHVAIGKTVIATSPGETPVRGVLSPASFPGLLFVLDYPDNKLKLLPGALPPADGERTFAYTEDTAVPTITVDVAGHQVDVLVDSTAPAGLTLPPREASDLPLADTPVEIGRVTDVLGEFPVSVATLNGIVGIGEWPLDIHSVVLCDFRSTSLMAEGNVGARILEGFIVTLDVKNRRIRFDRPVS